MNAARRILVVHLTERGADVVSVQPDLSYLQALVGGYIENMHLRGNLELVCNEHGSISDPRLPVHWIVNGERIHGDCFLTRSGIVDDDADYIGFERDEAVSLAAALSTACAAPRPWAVNIGRPA